MAESKKFKGMTLDFEFCLLFNVAFLFIQFPRQMHVLNFIAGCADKMVMMTIIRKFVTRLSLIQTDSGFFAAARISMSAVRVTVIRSPMLERSADGV
jgi:hypothetical protein